MGGTAVKKNRVFLVLALLCPAAGAQIVFPPVYKDKVGYSYVTAIFRRSNISSVRKCRWQQVQDLKPSSPVTIHGIAFRMTSLYLYNSHPDHPPFQVKLSLVLSTAKVKASGMSNEFGKNTGGDAVTVISPKFVHFPAHAGYGFPNPFAYRLPFDTGKVFTLGAGKSLCWDLRVYDNDLYSKAKTSVYLDEGTLTSNCFHTNFGKGGTVPGFSSPHSDVTRLYLSNARFFTVYGGCKNGPSSGWTLWLVSTGKWGGTLLGPSAPLWVDPLKALGWFGPYTLNSKGGYYRPPQNPYFSTPAQPWVLGFKFFGQWFSFDKALNLYTTDGTFSQFSLWVKTQGVDFGVGNLYLTNDSAFSSRKGTLYLRSGVVTQIY